MTQYNKNEIELVKTTLFSIKLRLPLKYTYNENKSPEQNMLNISLEMYDLGREFDEYNRQQIALDSEW